MLGPEKNKTALLKDIRNQPELVKLEMKKDFAVIVTKQPLFTEPVWDPRIIRVKPHTIDYRKKKHVWHLASFDKGILEKVYRFAKKHFGARLLKFKTEKLSDITITQLFPQLTSKQKRAMEIALSHGYYEYPKKITMEELAKIMKISYSTYQAHLKKAEARMMPALHSFMD